MVGALKDWETRIGRRLKLRDLHILSAVVQWGSMAKAAKHLSMTQPAISDAIASLEHTLGVRLLDRSSKGVEATIYASALIKRGLVVFDELRQGIKDIEFLVDPTLGEVRIGCPELLSAGLVPAIIERLSRRHPQITVYIVDAQPAATGFRELRERSVDLLLGRVFKPFSEDDVNMEVLCEDRFLLVVGAGSPWAQRRKITLAATVERSLDFVSSGQCDRIIRCGRIPDTRFGSAPKHGDDVFFARSHAPARDAAVCHDHAGIGIALQRRALGAQGAAD